jgi:outer membrane protein assembly factor BamB
MPRVVDACLLLIACCLLAGCAEPVEETTPEAHQVPTNSANADAAREPAPVDDLPEITVAENDWPWWRGPNVNNHATADQNPPLRWSEKEHVLWRVELPGAGHATPCVFGNRIFLPTGDPDTESIWLLCLDRATGNKLWQTGVYQGPFPKIHANNSPASATSACDGRHVYFPYQSDEAICMVAVDLNGQVAWNKPVGPYKSIQGYSASPALYKSLVIVPVDGSLGNSLVALHRGSGDAVWRAPLPKGLENYASPLVTHVAGRDQVVVIGGKETSSYDPASGELLWKCDGPADYCAAVAAFDQDTIYATGGYPQKAVLAIRADGTGDVTQTHLRWKSDKKAGYVPSPLLHQGLLYAVNDKGLMRCYDTANGQVVWEHATKAPFYSSPVLVGDRIYVFDREGKGYVFKAGRQFEMLATNELPHGAFATPVILDGRIYLRTLQDFYCLAETP